jgi:rhodanese-related sulfurtransferase
MRQTLLLSLLLIPAAACAQVQDANNLASGRQAAPVATVVLPNVAEDQVAPLRRTDAALYVTAVQAYELLRTRAGDVVLVDVRDRAEVMFAGQPERVDLHVPYAQLASPLTPGGQQWKRNPTFVADVVASLQQRNVDRDRPILLLCRSGLRSAIAADALTAAGFTRVYTVIDGFEGDVGASGRRDLNGWKNAGAPWRASPAPLAYGLPL